MGIKMETKMDVEKETKNEGSHRKKLTKLPLELLSKIFDYFDDEELLDCITLNKIIFSIIISKIYKEIKVTEKVSLESINFEKYGNYIKVLDMYGIEDPEEDTMGINILQFLQSNFPNNVYEVKCTNRFLRACPEISILNNFKVMQLIFEFSPSFDRDCDILYKFKDVGMLDNLESINIHCEDRHIQRILSCLPNTIKMFRFYFKPSLTLGKWISNIVEFTYLTTLFIFFSCEVNFDFNSFFKYKLDNLETLFIYASNSKHPDVIIDGNKFPKLEHLDIHLEGQKVTFENYFVSLKKLEVMVDSSFKEYSIAFHLFEEVEYINLYNSELVPGFNLQVPPASFGLIDFDAKKIPFMEPSDTTSYKLKRLDLIAAEFSLSFLHFLKLNCPNLETLYFYNNILEDQLEPFLKDYKMKFSLPIKKIIFKLLCFPISAASWLLSSCPLLSDVYCYKCDIKYVDKLIKELCPNPKKVSIHEMEKLTYTPILPS